MHSLFIKQCKNWTHAEKWISLTPLTKWTQNGSVLNIRPGTVKVLEQNIRKKLLNNSLGNNFLNITSKAQTPKAKTIELKSCCPAKKQQITYRMREIFYKPSIKLRVNIRTRLSDFTFIFHFHALEKGMATHSSVLAWRIPGTGEPGGLPSMGLHRVRHDWSDLAAAAGRDTEALLSYLSIILEAL